MVELDLPSQVELEKAKLELVRQLECIKIIREIVYYSFFLCALYAITFSNFGTHSFSYKNIFLKEVLYNQQTSPNYDQVKIHIKF